MMTDNLQQQIALKQRELDLLVAIDEIRDQITDDDAPNIMYLRLLKLFISHFNAEAGAVAVRHNEKGSPDTTIGIGLDEQRARALCEPVLHEDTATSVQPIVVANWAHAVGVRVMLRQDTPLGALVLLRGEHAGAFSEDDLAVLSAGEGQLDSAIVQAQRIWRLSRRDRELNAIYQLDQLRDANSDEKDLVNGFIQIVLEQLEAKLCMVVLSNIDSGEMTARGMVDRLNLQPHHYGEITDTLQYLSAISDLPSPKADVSLLASPFIINEMILGGVVVGKDTPFNASDRRLLAAMTSQMDSAIVYSRVIKQLSQRNKELQIIYHIDQIRDSETDFDAMLQAVLGEMCTAIESEMGYILLYSEDEEDQLEIKSSTEEGIIPSPSYYEAIHTISRRALETGEMTYTNEMNNGVRSIIAVPLILREKIIGVFGGLNSRHPTGFNAEDRRMLQAIVSQTDTAVFERMEQRRVRQVLGRSVDPKVLEHLLEHANTTDILAGERMNISVLFADLRGSTEWAERTEPDKLAMMLNTYLGRMADVIFEYGGTLDKFVGDEVIGLFGAPLPMPDHAERCAAAALKMQRVMGDLIKEMEAQGLELPQAGIGMSTGDAICGEFGTSQRTDYTAMGRMMNLGARLCSAAGGGEVVISEKTFTTLGKQVAVEKLEEVTAKGIGQVTAYKLLKLESIL